MSRKRRSRVRKPEARVQSSIVPVVSEETIDATNFENASAHDAFTHDLNKSSNDKVNNTLNSPVQNARVGHEFSSVSLLSANQQTLKQSVPVQAKLKAGQPNEALSTDRFEGEADRIAEQVMASSAPVLRHQSGIQANNNSSNTMLKIQENKGGENQGENKTTAAESGSGVSTQRSGGHALSADSLSFFESRFKEDFSQVRVHTDQRSTSEAEQLGARAFTQGNDLVFATGEYQPESTSGRKLIAHELAHVVQQRGSGGSPSQVRIQKKVVPEDVSEEMLGRVFTLTKPFSTTGLSLKAGTEVTVRRWDNASDTISVVSAGSVVPFLVPRTSLKPKRQNVAGVAPFSAGVSAQAAVVEKAEQQLQQWLAKQSSHKSKQAIVLFLAERKRLEGLLKKRQFLLNRRLIQETMFNRFDGIIKQEVDAANTKHGFSAKDALNPNLVKSMLFQESQLGTAGEHLELPASVPFIKTRFNLGQVIDSSGLALMELLESERPGLMKSELPNMRRDMLAAQRERRKLQQKKKPSIAESNRLLELNNLAVQNWEAFIWGYQSPATGKFFADMVADFFASQSPALNVNYTFWIRIAVRWLFKKHTPGRSWPETFRAYNGGGQRARDYRDAVISRATKAEQAEKAGTEFIPDKI